VKKGSIEFSTQQVIMLILMIILAVILILFGIKYGGQIKDLVMKLFDSSGNV
jgi:hypothetical protein